jgi:type II secretory pathway pseudopilin PulG
MKLFKGQKGLSLVEVTIMLLVLMLLTGVLAPSIMDYVKDAQWVKVKEDCEAIAVSVARLTRDSGSCLQLTAGGGCTISNRADVLYSDGTPATSFPSAVVFGGAVGNTTNWDDLSNDDTLKSQLVTNGPDYQTPLQLGFSQYPGPNFNMGWRGAYLSPEISPDPWGHRYYVNTEFMSVASDAVACGNAYGGCRDGGWEADVFCISAGPNGFIETPFASNNGQVARNGDDFVTIIQGSTR